MNKLSSTTTPIESGLTPMAWNEPGKSDKPNDKPDQNDPWNRNKRPASTSGPDLDEVFKKIKSLFGSSKNGNGNNGNSGNSGGFSTPKNFGILPVVVLVAGLGLWLASGIYTVDEGRRGVELVFGKYNATTEPGLNWRFPSPIGAHKIIDTSRRSSLKIGAIEHNKTSSNGDNESQMLTKDEAIVVVSIEVQFQIIDPEAYWFNVNGPEATLKQVVESAARERVGQTNLDDILTSGRAQLMVEVKDLSQTVLDLYKTGLLITNVNLEDAQPPRKVQDAFSDAIRAREDEQSRRNLADAYDRQIVLEAEGEAAREVNNAEAYRDRLIAEATGEAARFSKLYNAYRLAPEITKSRLYLETMEQVLSQTSKIIMDQQSNNLMVLPLEQILKTQANSASQSSQQGNNLNSTLNYTRANPPLIDATKTSDSAAQETRMRTRQ
ncbi:modulator for HflB protease specific for phage lambda cII repressor [Gammaproteobacteria bacterium]|nr:modulator for HflB protease specific for phage lambda cII repressor [Gammaproteobacteria bacterium]